MTDSRSEYSRCLPGILAGTAFVVIWRLGALLSPSNVTALPVPLRLPMAGLGLLFLVSSLIAWTIRPGHWTRLLLLYGLGGAVHWGGGIGAASPELERALFYAYLTATALFDAAILHLAMVFPQGGRLARNRMAALYTPALIAFSFIPLSLVTPEGLNRMVAGLVLLLANLLGLAAGVVFTVSLFRVDRSTRQAARLPLLVGAFFLAILLSLTGAASSGTGTAEAWNLAFGIVPVSLAYSLSSSAIESLQE